MRSSPKCTLAASFLSHWLIVRKANSFECRLKAFYPDGALKSDSYARIATDAHFKRLQSLLQNTKGQIVIGGETDAAQRFFAPTVVNNVSPDDSLMGEEIFGPILPIVIVKNIDDAINFVNSR